jgi:hypothetical protein
VAISGSLAATFAFAIVLLFIYAGLALARKIKPSFESAYTLMGGAAAVATSLRLLWLIFFESVQGLSNTDKFYLLIGAATAGWFGCSGMAKTFNKLFDIQLEEKGE